MPSTHAPLIEEYCPGCVYHPSNLPQSAYSAADWAMLQARACSFDHVPGTVDCLGSRKTSCSLVDLATTRALFSGSHE